MPEALTGQLIERDVAARHDELMQQFAAGVADMCVALHFIRSEETYRARGHETYAAFLREIGIAPANGKFYANVGPALLELRRTRDDALVRHVDMLKPIAGMLHSKQPEQVQRGVVKRQAAIVRLAAETAKRSMVPLDAKLIALTAEQRFGWKTREAYLAARREKKRRERTPAEVRAQMRQDIELALGVIVGYQRTGWELVQELGDPRQWACFADALRILKDAEDA